MHEEYLSVFQKKAESDGRVLAAWLEVGITVELMPLTEVLIIESGNQRDRGVKNCNPFLTPEIRQEIEAALVMEGVNRENLAKAHLRLVAIMQRRGPSIAEQCGMSYSVALESAVVRYVCRELIQLYCA